MKTVSVVIPVYNAEDAIRRCLDSIFAQDYAATEVVAIDDGSTDNSLAILNEYRSTHSNLRVISQTNQGIARTRNRGIEIATGDFLLFVDNDDTLDQDYIQTYIHHLDQDYDIVIGGWRRRDSTGKLIYERRMKGFEWETYINTYPWDKLYKREFLLQNDVRFLDYGIGEDVYFTLRAKASNPKIKLIDYVGYTWFLEKASVSNTAHKGLNKNLDVIHLLNKVDGLFGERPQLLGYYYKRFLVWYMLYSGRDSDAASFMAEYHRLWAWLRAHQGSTLTPFSRLLGGEKPFERLSVFGFSVIGALRLMRPFAVLYCTGRAQRPSHQGN